MKIGILALQGAFLEHEKVLKAMDCNTVQVRKQEQLEDIAGLIIPGGESTTIGKLLIEFGLQERLISLVKAGMPLFGTCAGLIVMAKDIENSSQSRLGLMDITAKRNAFGRQVDSFEADLFIDEIGQEPFKAVFIRAPFIAQAGPEVQILSSIDGKAVLARQNNLLASAFHPELTNDFRIHQYFINMIKN